MSSKIVENFGNGINPVYGPPVIEPKHTLASINKTSEFLGWNPCVRLGDGLDETIEFFVK